MGSWFSPKLWEKMAELSPDMFCSFDKAGYFVHVSAASKSILGYSSEELIGRHFTEILHPDDLLATQEALKNLQNGSETTNFENCYIHKNGSIVPFLWSAVWSEEDQVALGVARDITEIKNSRLKLEESEQLYKTLFQKNPDVIFIQDKQGLVTEVNQRFSEVFGLSREEALNRPTTSFLPPDMVPVCVNNFQESLQGKTVKYDLEMITVNNDRRIYNVVKFPVILENEVLYIKTILKDITPIVRSYETIKQQACKLNTIFESITDAFFMLDREWKIIYINSEAERLLKLDRRQHIGESILNLFPKEEGGQFASQYTYAFETGKAVHFTSYLKDLDVWFQVKAYPSSEGLSIYFDDVTEMMKTSQELERLSLVASKVTNGVIICDKDERIEWVNEGFSKLFGYSFEEVEGTNPFKLLRNHMPDHMAFEVKDKVRRGEAVSFEISSITKSGDEIWVSVQLSPILDETGALSKLIAIHTDITERVKSRLELEKLSLVASKTDNSVLIADKDWKIEWVNDGFSRLMGYSIEEASGKKPSELLHNHKTDKAVYYQLEKNLYQGEAISLEVLNIKKSGEEVWVNIEINPILNEQGTLVRFIEVQTDITALKNSEIELKKLATDLYKQNNDLQQFTYIVSHNLRSPVANALGIADLLTRVNKHSEVFDKSLSNLKQSVLKLDTVLKDMNTILSIRDNKGNLEQEQVDVNSVIQQVLSSLQEALSVSEGKVSIDIEEGYSVWANKAYLYSIFYNLLSNSIKYRSAERPLRVRIKCYGNTKSSCLLSFDDNGSGFDMKKAGDNIFRLYKRFHTDKKGRGIGLYLVKTHLEAMGGHVEVNSLENIGTRFLISLPKIQHEDIYH